MRRLGRCGRRRRECRYPWWRGIPSRTPARKGRGRKWATLQWYCQQRVDLVAVQYYDAFAESVRGCRDVDPVLVNAGGEQCGCAVVHDARSNEVRAYYSRAALHGLQADRADDVAVAVRFEDICTADGKYAIEQHAARRGVNHALPHPRRMIGAADDEVPARVGKQIRPFLQPVLIDAFGVIADQLVYSEAYCDLVHHQSPISER